MCYPINTAFSTSTTIRYDDIVIVWEAVAVMGARGWEVDLVKNGQTVAEGLGWDDVRGWLEVSAQQQITRVLRGLRGNKPVKCKAP